ncbi:MAG: hypothetical protein LBQ66_12295, partial [Planctomycetaceae bacterium]|nr:hypothetical protein [Planctomycetaceae bacterium]
MKKLFIAVSVVLTAVLTHAACNMANAGEHIVGLYKLTILPNDPSYLSKVPRLFDNPTTDWYDAKNHKPLEGKTFTNDISVNFKLTLQMNDPKKGYEDVRHNAKDTTFTVSIIEGSNSYIRNVRTSSTSLLFRYINNCQEATRTQRTGMPPQIKPILIALE